MSISSKVQFFSLQGISCAGCVRSVEKALLALQAKYPELESYSINFADRTAIISGELAAEHFILAIKNAGYDAALLTSEEDREQLQLDELKYLKSTFMKSFIAMAAGMSMMAWQMFATPSLMNTAGLLQGTLFALISALIMFFCAAKTYRGAWLSFRHLAFNMDTLIALGTLSAWGYSFVLLLLISFTTVDVPIVAQHLYFDASAMVLGFILLGQALEAKVRGSTAKAVQSLVKLKPTVALRKNKQEKFESVPAQLLIPGDIVLVKPAQIIPADGDVIEGTTSVDESMISGESLGVTKREGDSVIGSTLNGRGVFTFKVSRVGKDTVLSQIIAQVRQAQNSKPKIGQFADKVAAVFVPIVLLIALVTAIAWWWFTPDNNWSYILSATMSVLIIACPCALGLATPMSTMVGVGLAAKKGVLIQKGDALQTAQNLTTVVLDKTGTITEGKPKVTEAMWLSKAVDQSKVLYGLNALEEKSEHPLAQAVVDYCLEQAAGDNHHDIALENIESVMSLGACAKLDGLTLKVGSINWLGDSLESTAVEISEQWMAEANSVVLIEYASELVLMLAISDAIKVDSKNAIEQLQQQGLKVVILSGDKQESVAAIAKQVSITQYQAELSSEQKLAAIIDMQQNGEVVAMVGDGVNDAPALAIADLGCAIGTGTDVAINSADITLMRGSLLSVIDAINISKLTLLNIKQNLGAAFIYNILAIPVAAGVLFPVFGLLLNPMYAGAAMALSSVSVVSNAYRLSYKIKTL